MKTLDRALNLIELITVEKPCWTLTEFAVALNLHTSIVYRIVNSLEKRDYLRREAHSKRYQLGYKVLERAAILEQQIEVRHIAYPVMQSLAKDTGESIFLTVPDKNRYSICIEKIESQQSLALTLKLGSSTPLHAGASAKILLAYLPEKITEEYINGSLEKVTINTITDREDLKKEVRQIRARGYATSDGENNPGVFAVSVPLFDYSEQLIAGLSIGGPSTRFDEQKLHYFVDQLKQGALEIHKYLGNNG